MKRLFKYLNGEMTSIEAHEFIHEIVEAERLSTRRVEEILNEEK